MADISNLPVTTPTVDLSGGENIEGDPLEFMQQKAKDSIDSVANNQIVAEEKKTEFKKNVLLKLKENITKFEEIDKKAADKKAQEEAAKKDENGENKEEEDPFEDIFGAEEGEEDESTKEKKEIAGSFAKYLKKYKEDFLKDIRIKGEQAEQEKDKEKMDDILGQLNQI